MRNVRGGDGCVRSFASRRHEVFTKMGVNSVAELVQLCQAVGIAAREFAQ